MSAFGPWPAPRNFNTYIPSSSASTIAGSDPPSRKGVTYLVAATVLSSIVCYEFGSSFVCSLRTRCDVYYRNYWSRRTRQTGFNGWRSRTVNVVAKSGGSTPSLRSATAISPPCIRSEEPKTRYRDDLVAIIL